MKSEGRRIIKLQPPKIIRTIVFLALPTFLIGLLLIGTTCWHIPTDMQVRFRARSVTFKVGGSKLQSLVDGASFQALMVRKFSRMTFPIPVSLDAIDKTLEPERITPLPLPSQALAIDGRLDDPSTPSSVRFESPPSDRSSSIIGTLEVLRIPAGSEVTLNLPADQITKPAIRIDGTQTSVKVLLKETFRLSAENCELPPELQSAAADQQAVTFQLRLPASDPRIDISPQPGAIEFALTVARGSTANMFSKAAIPITKLDFNPHPIKYIEITYPGIKKIITETGIDPVALKDLDGFEIRNLRLNSIDNVLMLNSEVNGLEFQLNGIVRDHETGSFGTSRDYRLTVFDKIWSNPAMVILLVILVWGSSTLAGGYLLYKDYVIPLKTQHKELRDKNMELKADLLELQKNHELIPSEVSFSVPPDLPDNAVKGNRIPSELYNKIKNILLGLPVVKTLEILCFEARFDQELQTQLKLDGSPAEIVSKLLTTALRYGNLQDGRNPIEALLEVAKGYFGVEKREECDQLIRELQHLSQK